ncbi:MAG: transglutaminaseTgpA domain-containing protein [Puniceicoccaceae bacterium]
MAKLESRELAAIRWLMGQLLVLISLSGSYSLDLGADFLITAGIGLTVMACLFPRVAERIPSLFWNISPFILLILIISDFVLGGGDILPPLFRMVLVLTLYRTLQIRTPREDLQLLLLALFLLILTGVLSQEITFGLQMLLFAPLAMGQLFVVNLSTDQSGKGPTPKRVPVFENFSWRQLFRHVWERFDRRTLAAGCLLFLLTTGMALLLFILLPRFDLGAALPFPRLQTGQSLSGFTDNVSYGDVVSILDDDSIAMRVDVQAEQPPARPYWRMVVLDAYHAGGFMVSPAVARDRRQVQNYRFSFELPSGRTRSPSTWTLYLEGGISAYLPAGDSFSSLRFRNRTSLEIHDLTRVYKTIRTNANTLSLRYENMGFEGVLPPGAEDWRLPGMQRLITDTSSPDYLSDVTYPQTLLTFPEGEANVRIMRKILRATGFERGMPVTEFAQRVAAYLQQEHDYGLQSTIPGGEADRLLRWVDSDGPGHCELFAGAFVLIARYAGYPSRLVTGFAGGDWNGFENYYMVRNRHAHAWCEVYDPEAGWLRIDPTPGSGSAEGSVASALSGGRLFADRTWQAYLDSLRILWFRRVIQFDSDDQAEMADVVKGAGARGLDWVTQQFKYWRERFRSDVEAFSSRGEISGLLRDVAMPLAMVVLVVVLLLMLRRRSRRLGFEQIMRRKAGRVLQQRQLRQLPVDRPEHREVQLIRFGPVTEWPEDPGKRLAQISRQR